MQTVDVVMCKTNYLAGTLTGTRHFKERLATRHREK